MHRFSHRVVTRGQGGVAHDKLVRIVAAPPICTREPYQNQPCAGSRAAEDGLGPTTSDELSTATAVMRPRPRTFSKPPDVFLELPDFEIVFVFGRHLYKVLIA